MHRIGEAVSRLEDGFIAEHPAVEWQKMKGRRNVVAQEYGFIDYRIAWRALSDVFPKDVPRSSASSNRIESARSSRQGVNLAGRFREMLAPK